MIEQEKKELCEKVAKVWTEDEQGIYCDFDVKVTIDNKEKYTVKVSRMYEYVPIAFKHLKKLAEIFGTEDFDVDNWSSSGCETCDYGSSYQHEFTVLKKKI